MKPPLYLDHNATAPVRPEAAAAVAEVLGAVGNASSVHAFGRAAHRTLEEAREAVAALVGAAPAGVVFTSGGSEANNLAIRGCGRSRAVVSAVEHDSVLGAAPAAARARVDGDGVADLDDLTRLLDEADGPAVVSLMLANNETGVLQPVAEAAAIAHARGALVHCDAVQAAGRTPIDMAALGIDLLTLSAHKIGGPQGVGALVLAPGVEIQPLIGGGGQERRRRPGTENLPGIAGFGAAARLAAAEYPAFAAVASLRDGLEREIRSTAPDAVVFGAGVPRVANTSCLATPGLSAETQVMALDMAGIAVSAGSACSSGRVEPSHVLTAMGAGDLAACAIRVSFGRDNAEADVGRFVEAWSALYARARGRSARKAAVAGG